MCMHSRVISTPKKRLAGSMTNKFLQELEQDNVLDIGDSQMIHLDENDNTPNKIEHMEEKEHVMTTLVKSKDIPSGHDDITPEPFPKTTSGGFWNEGSSSDEIVNDEDIFQPSLYPSNRSSSKRTSTPHKKNHETFSKTTRSSKDRQDRLVQKEKRNKKQSILKSQRPPCINEIPPHQNLWEILQPPSNVNEVFVHKRKREEVERWVQLAFSNFSRKSTSRLLFLCGPSGTYSYKEESHRIFINKNPAKT